MPPDGLRVSPGPACERGAPVQFRFDGRRIHAFEGETVGAALHAEGERVLMRSIKYHRPRGLFCNAGKCASCLVRIDGVPNVRACTTPVRDGMKVRSQNAIPGVRRDALGIIDTIYPRNLEMHERFTRAPLVRGLFQRIVRRMAGFGRVPDVHRPLPPRPPIARESVDVLVVGAGPSGLSAAVAAAEGAASVLCVDEADRIGGTLLLHRDVGGRSGPALADGLDARLREAGGVALARSTALGVYLTDGVGEGIAPPGVVPVLTPGGIREVRARALVVASGYHETPPLIPNNDLPGVMGVRAGLVLLHRHGVLPGRRVALAGEGELIERAAEDLPKAGATIVRIDAPLVRAEGRKGLQRVTFGSGARARTEEVDALLAALGPRTPRVELLQQAGARIAWRAGEYAPLLEGPASSAPGVFAAGSLAGPLPLGARMAAGARAGEAAATWARGRRP